MKKTIWLLALLAAQAGARPLTPTDLQEITRIGPCQISPDGRFLALQTSRWDGSKSRSTVQIHPLPWSRFTVHIFPDSSGPRWSPDSSQLLLHVKKVPQVCSSTDWEGKPVRGLPKDAETVIFSPNGQQLAFAAPVPQKKRKDSGRLYDDLFLRRWDEYYDGKRRHLYVMPVKGGQPRDVTPGDADAYPTSGTFSHGDNFCYSADGRALLFSAPEARGQASSTNYDVFRLDLASGKRENLTGENPAADMGPRLSPDGKTLYIFSQQRPGYESDFRKIRSRPVDASGRPTGAWKEGDEYGDFLPTTNGQLVTKYEKAATHAYLNGTLLNERGSLHGLSVDRQGRNWAGVLGSMSHPPELVVNGEVRDYFPWMNALGLLRGSLPFELGAVESVDVPVEGASMQMWIIKPPNFDAHKKWPVAYLIHGGPQGGWSDDWSTRWNPHAWAARGYVVAMPNPRGSSGQGAAFQEGVSRDWGGKPYRDLMSGADFMAAQSYVDPQRMVAAGASYGGYMVNWISVHTGRFKALVTHDGVWNLDSMYGTTDELWFSDWEFGGPPWKDRTDYEKYSPHRFADQLAVYKTPHMVIHNDLDYRCPIDQGLQLFTALRLQGVPSQFLNFPDEGHWVLKPRNSIRWYTEVFRFVERNCPPGGR